MKIVTFFLIFWSHFQVCSLCDAVQYGTVCHDPSNIFSWYSSATNCSEINQTNCEQYKYAEVYWSYFQCIDCAGYCSINNGGCSHTCFSLEFNTGFCLCPFGMFLSFDWKTCIDPCDNNGCSDNCTVEYDTAVCSCPTGMKLQEDGKQCEIDRCYNNGCLYTCSAESGIAVCSCPVGMKLQADGKQCEMDPCFNRGCSHTCTEESGYGVCSCPFGMKLQLGGSTCSYDVCYNQGCSRICPDLLDGCYCSTTMTFQPDALECVYDSHKVTAVFDVSSSQVTKDVVKMMLESSFFNFCSQRLCYYVKSDGGTNMVDQLKLSAYLSAFSSENNRLTLSFFIINSVKDVLTKETVEGGLNLGITFEYENKRMALISYGGQKSAKSNIKTINVSLAIILTCYFCGLVIFIAAITFFVHRSKKRAKVHHFVVQFTAETQTSSV